MIVCILGRQPELGIAELESVVGSDRIKPIGPCAALVDSKTALNQNNLGGTIKMAELIKEVDSTEINSVMSALRDTVIECMSVDVAHKQTFGISAYGLNISARRISELSFLIKKSLKAKSVSVRAIISNSTTLNSAQVIHNGLTGRSGSEFIVVSDKHRSYIARTISVQDIDSYSKRDYERPRRDMRVGMLPPKLAQIMLNLAKAEPRLTVLDPFCGTGVVLIEAALMGLKLEGSDIKREMITNSKENLEWLAKEYHIKVDQHISCADATINKWKHFDRVVTETYLGPQPPRNPDPAAINRIATECNFLVFRFLKNLRGQIGAETRCCIAIPAWPTKGGIIRLPLAKQIEKIGYTEIRFKNAGRNGLIYMRPDQYVARELLVLVPKNNQKGNLRSPHINKDLQPYTQRLNNGK